MEVGLGSILFVSVGIFVLQMSSWRFRVELNLWRWDWSIGLFFRLLYVYFLILWVKFQVCDLKKEIVLGKGLKLVQLNFMEIKVKFYEEISFIVFQQGSWVRCGVISWCGEVGLVVK